MVCGAELPVENTLVLTSCRGITGAGGSGERARATIFTDGAGTSLTFGFGSAAGTRNGSDGGSTLAVAAGFHNCLKG
jgi:hypothetical protein